MKNQNYETFRLHYLYRARPSTHGSLARFMRAYVADHGLPA